ncbi:MAG: DUF4198 domain-containing protein [Alteromonadales bacterium]|nr:DUF4198 domain-containing protein [Alteromonadales bacterium]
MFELFKKYDVHLSPVIKGKVLLDGKPLADQKVTRSLIYGDDNEKIDSVMSSQDGSFYFPEVNIRSRRPGSMFDESKVRQIILIERENQKYLLWYTNTLGIKPAQAISESLLSLQCDLNSAEEAFEFPSVEHPELNHFTYSICRW